MSFYGVDDELSSMEKDVFLKDSVGLCYYEFQSQKLYEKDVDFGIGLRIGKENLIQINFFIMIYIGLEKEI